MRITSLHAPVRKHLRQQGVGIIELLIGVALGLVVVSGIIGLFVSAYANSRTMALENRVNQELRSAAELISRDLRRSGYWANAINGTIASGVSSSTAINPHVNTIASTNAISYSFSQDANDTLDANEQFGFRLNGSVLEMQTTDGTWTEITNGNLLTISTFTITPRVTALPVGSVCPTACDLTSSTCPRLTVRQYDLLIRANATSKPEITRELRSSIRMRNEQFTGVCPL